MMTSITKFVISYTDFDNLQFPLLFTDNSKANPAVDGKKPLTQTYSNQCRSMFAGGDTTSGHTKGYVWESPTENGRAQNYTPCPPDLMKDRTNLV